LLLKPEQFIVGQLGARGTAKSKRKHRQARFRCNFEVAELAKSLVVVLNSRPKSGDFGYIFES